jgi:hypothetical protein
MLGIYEHVCTLLKYAGISFIAGAVNHGMFSEERSILTAAVGILCYLLAGYITIRTQAQSEQRWSDFFGYGILSSIGLGFFTGGLQHFPDSPLRSAWVVPLGFFLSWIALYFQAGQALVHKQKSFLLYGLLACTLIAASSLAASWALSHHWIEWGHDDHHNQDHVHDH